MLNNIIIIYNILYIIITIVLYINPPESRNHLNVAKWQSGDVAKVEANVRMARKQLKNGREATQEWQGSNVRMAGKQRKNEAEAMEEFIEKMKVRKLFGQVRKKS